MSPTAELLRRAGLRVTAPRLAVLEILQAAPHADAASVLAATRAQDVGVSVQGVYDVLAALYDAGVLRRIQPAHSVARFEIDHGDNHHHAVCRACGDLVDVPCVTGEPPCLDPRPATTTGFAVDEAEVIFWGLCPDCQHAAPGPVPEPVDPTTHHEKEQV